MINRNMKNVTTLVFVAGMVLSVVCFKYEQHRLLKDVRLDLSVDIELVQNLIESSFSHEVFILSMMAEDNETIEERWSRRANRIVRHLNLQALEQTDGTVVKWLAPIKGNEKAQGLDLSFEEKRREAMRRAADSHEEVFSGPIQLVQGGTGILMFSPIYENGQNTGFVLGVIRTQDHFPEVIDGAEALLAQRGEYMVEIRSGDEVLYSRGKRQENSMSRGSTLYGLDYELTIGRAYKNPVNILVMGFLTTIALSVLVHVIGSIHMLRVGEAEELLALIREARKGSE